MQPHKYHIRLSSAEKQVLRQLTRNGKTERRLADRARLILWTVDQCSVEEIAHRLGLHRSTVSNWRQWFWERRQQGKTLRECLQDNPRSGRPPTFKATEIAQIKAVACEQPTKLELPLSRFSVGEIVLWIKQATVVASISPSSVWRLLHRDAIRPWYYRGWLFPRDPHFLAKASPVLDLYQRIWQGRPLGPNDYVISADEKSAIQVLTRRHPPLPPGPGAAGRFEFEYQRNGTLAYLAALDVLTGHVFGRIDSTTGLVPFGKLVDLVMGTARYATGARVFWILDGGPSHHPNTTPARLQATYPNLIPVFLPTHASWLNQIEIYFSIVQRKALTPMDLPDKPAVTDRILNFQERYDQTAKPFRWNFTREDLQKRLRAVAN
ncbi:MAG: IS630 family transposase [Chloroflexi bacterium]|nr:IS630 family transposase [Chloroflexota bacterium]